MQTAELKPTHSLWSSFLPGPQSHREVLGAQSRGAAQTSLKFTLPPSLTAYTDGNETSCYRVIFERILLSKVFITMESLFLNLEEYYNDSLSVIAYPSCTMLLLSTQAMPPRGRPTL